MPKCLIIFYFFCIPWAFSQQHITVSGFIKEKDSGELLPGVNVYPENSSITTSSNNYGFYSITLPSSEIHKLVFSFVGFQKVIKEINSNRNLELNIELVAGNQLEEFVVNAQIINEKVSEQVEMSKLSIPVSQIKKIPAFLGEKDVLKVLQLMPGVQKGTEGQAGIYVRGGGPDQNLLILDDATVYNSNHLFGFFSVFNGDALKSVELTKGGFPARFGGRLSSVIEMQMREGNKTELKGEGGVGLISSRLTLEGPIIKNKASFLVSARRTYIDVLAKPFIKKQLRDDSGGEGSGTAGYFFYDLNAKVNFEISQKDKLFVSGFFGNDKFSINNKQPTLAQVGALKWGNQTGTLRWNHLYNNRLFSNSSLIFSKFNFGINNQLVEYDEDKNPISDFSLFYKSGISDYSLKLDYDYFISATHTLKFGIQAINHTFRPSAYILNGSDVNNPINIPTPKLKSWENGAYLEDLWVLSAQAKVNAGLRVSYFDTEEKRYLRPEPRVSFAYKMNSNLAAKASYATMNQYIHLLSNTGIGLPTDLWVPTTSKVAPQQSMQWAMGLARDLENKGLTFTLEGYYKKMNNIISYKEGSTFLGLGGSDGNSDWQENVTAGKGWSYGTEILFQKKSGKLSGWIGYTLSWSQWQFEELNFGRKFYPKYDRRHDASVVGIYELNKKVTFSAVWVYGTGNALTLPIASFSLPSTRPNFIQDEEQFTAFGQYNDYGSRNAFRAEAYHRLDLSAQFHKQKKKYERTWEIGLFNAYNRRNPFFYQAVPDPDPKVQKTILQRISLIPVIPSISYNFKF